MQVELSILICTLERRHTMLRTLLGILNPQVAEHEGRVEIVIERDAGEASIGVKRQRLLDRAKGAYVAFIDDDDQVSPAYVQLVMRAIKAKPDVVGITGIYFVNGVRKKPFHHTLECKEWYETPQAYWRSPNHLNPIKIEHARAIGFADMNHGEDRKYSEALQVSGLLVTEAKIAQPIYKYLYNTTTTQSKKQ